MLEENIGKLLEIAKKTNGTFAYISENGQLYITDFLFSILYWIPSIDSELMVSLKEIYGSLLQIPNLYKQKKESKASLLRLLKQIREL